MSGKKKRKKSEGRGRAFHLEIVACDKVRRYENTKGLKKFIQILFSEEKYRVEKYKYTASHLL